MMSDSNRRRPHRAVLWLLAASAAIVSSLVVVSATRSGDRIAASTVPVDTTSTTLTVLPDPTTTSTTVTTSTTAAPPLDVAAPVVSITVPDGAGFVDGDPVELTATAVDAVDGDVAGSLVWTSDLDGVIGGGPTIEVLLSSGTHAIDAGVADAAGNVGSNSVLVTVTPREVLLIGAGDIARCSRQNDEDTARLIDDYPTATVFTLGDNAYPDGTPAEFAECYEESWGRHRARTMPAAGNHDYDTSRGAGYYRYFGSVAGDPEEGWYSYNIGSWHIVVLNSNCRAVGGCGPTSPQGRWLQADLAAHSGWGCTLAYWHQPRFSSGPRGDDDNRQTLWDTLYAYGADVILNGHDHHYERFAPQDPSGTLDPDNGIRQFIVGTGGTGLVSFVGPPAPATAERQATDNGVLLLRLADGSYKWEFLPTAGGSSTDVGSGSCVDAANRAPVVEIDSPDQSVIVTGEPVSLIAGATDPEDGDRSADLVWVSDLDGTFGVGPAVDTSGLSPGVHRVTAAVSDSAGVSGSATLTIVVTGLDGSVVIERRVEASSSDAEERPGGVVRIERTDLPLPGGGFAPIAAVRFDDIDIPRGATITNAYIQFTANQPAAGSTLLDLRAEATDDAMPFAFFEDDVSTRPTTIAVIRWEPGEWLAPGDATPAQRTPNLAALLQETVDRSGWNNGGAVVFVITGAGNRIAESFDGSPQQAPLIHIEFTMPGG